MTDRNRDIPQKPLKYYLRNDDIAHEPCVYVIGTAVWFCPEESCGIEVMRSDNYCPHCGQRLDWSEGAGASD